MGNWLKFYWPAARVYKLLTLTRDLALLLVGLPTGTVDLETSPPLIQPHRKRSSLYLGQCSLEHSQGMPRFWTLAPLRGLERLAYGERW